MNTRHGLLEYATKEKWSTTSYPFESILVLHIAGRTDRSVDKRTSLDWLNIFYIIIEHFFPVMEVFRFAPKKGG